MDLKCLRQSHGNLICSSSVFFSQDICASLECSQSVVLASYFKESRKVLIVPPFLEQSPTWTSYSYFFCARRQHRGYFNDDLPPNSLKSVSLSTEVSKFQRCLNSCHTCVLHIAILGACVRSRPGCLPDMRAICIHCRK